jgi:hypothetical protein
VELVHGASASTKSLNYSTDYWSGSGNRYDNAFLFITGFSMGNVLETWTSMPNGLPRGSTYHSISAKVGDGLASDEYIVYGLSQTTITHLIELGRT